jgi:putative redox protein
MPSPKRWNETELPQAAQGFTQRPGPADHTGGIPMNAVVTWKQGMSFDATADTGFVVPLGADPAVGGANDGFRPMELLAMGLAGCTAMDVISILSKKRQKLSGFEVQVRAERADEHPKVFTSMHIHYVVRGEGIDAAAVERAMDLSATKYCPAQAMLGKAAEMTMDYEIVEEAVAAG